MAIQSSGAISLSDLQTEFGGSNPISLSEYYQNADPDLVSSNNTNVPNTGNPIDLSDFYGATNQFTYTFSSNTQEVDLNSTLTTAGWNGSDPVAVTINSGVYIWSDSISTAALIISSAFNGLLTITNNGYIIGRGGNGGNGRSSGQSGGPAISNSATGVTLTNASSAFIAGGGGGGGGGESGGTAGGGGGGAGGGVGGTGTTSAGTGGGGAGGSVGQSGSNAAQFASTIAGNLRYLEGGFGGGSGGGGGESVSGEASRNGGGGGRVLAGTGGDGGRYFYTSSTPTGSFSKYTGDGGDAGSAGGSATGSGSGGGGGGWGAAGGSGGYAGGGSGGAAISGTAIATYTNNGTVYGSVA